MEYMNIYNKMTYIYLVENCYNDPNKVYIGKTINNRSKPHTRTYGKNIIYTVIDQVNSLTHTDWKLLEKYWIEQFRQWGYKIMNINKNGGQGPSSYSEESKIKMRKPRKLGTGNKISQKLKENNHSQHYTDDVRKKISEGNKGKLKPFTEKHKQNMLLAKRKQAKLLLMFDLEGNFIKEWESKGQAAEWLKEKTGKTSNLTTQIKDCILGRQKTAFGYKWKYK
jgi:hypothetical protein